MDLHGNIMNLPCKPDSTLGTEAETLAFKMGHKQARHGAAELASAYCAEQREAGPVDTGPTTEVILKMATEFEERAAALRRIAGEITETQDLTRVSEAVSAVTSTFANLRLDLLTTRPLRALGVR